MTTFCCYGCYLALLLTFLSPAPWMDLHLFLFKQQLWKTSWSWAVMAYIRLLWMSINLTWYLLDVVELCKPFSLSGVVMPIQKLNLQLSYSAALVVIILFFYFVSCWMFLALKLHVVTSPGSLLISSAIVTLFCFIFAKHVTVVFFWIAQYYIQCLSQMYRPITATVCYAA